MARFCGEHDSGPILRAAEFWRERALLGGGSVFSDHRLWEVQHLSAIQDHVGGQPDTGKGNFFEKLKGQLGATKPEVKQLAAEMLWVMFLCPSNMNAETKRDGVQIVWKWSGESLRMDSQWLRDDVLNGVGSAGPGYGIQRWRELTYFARVLLQVRQLEEGERSGLLADPWQLASWLEKIQDGNVRQLRHMLLFLLHPDTFERIFGGGDRRLIVMGFTGRTQPQARKLSALQIDQELANIRKEQEQQHPGQDLDYYLTPLKEQWQAEGFDNHTKDIERDDVLAALKEIDEKGIPENSESTIYDLIFEARRYPPKVVLSLASKQASGQEFDRSLFTGGNDSRAFNLLRELGFEIEAKDAIPSLVAKFRAQAAAEKELSVQGYLREYRGLDVKVSFGQGVFSRIPWIAFLANGQRVSEGIYPVFLLFREQNVLLLCYGLSEENEPQKSWGEFGKALTVQEWFRDRYRRNPDRYGASYVKAAYELKRSLQIQDLNRELDLMIDQYKQVMGAQAGRPDVSRQDVLPVVDLPARQDLGEVVRSFSAALRKSFVSFGTGHDDLVASFIASLAAKPLVILTGLSGSGKTQLAMRLGEWLGQGRLHMAAVRPDWTGAEALFGYEDGLKPTIDGQAAWHVPAPLEFMLKAFRDPAHPYLLLLDEMNLAHVERYFADTLSGMESGQACLPNLVRGADGLWRLQAGAPDRVAFPRNLWIVGTVNVDETTYTFSPKVLDRANTFEFRVTGGDLQSDPRKPKPCEPGDPGLLRGLLAIARDDGWHQANPATFDSPLREKLKQLHGVLERYGFEFGHRVFYEALRFAALAEKAGLGGLETALDRIVMQKVLPRLHGSRRRLELPILALLHFCRDLPDSVGPDDQLPALAVEKRPETGVRLPVSYDKLCRMLRNLQANQFASFTE